MDPDSIGATIYAVWNAYFLDSLFRDYISDPGSRLALVNGYPFQDFY